MRLVQAHEVPALTAVVSPEASACQCRARAAGMGESAGGSLRRAWWRDLPPPRCGGATPSKSTKTVVRPAQGGWDA